MTKGLRFISVEDAVKTAWMILEGLGYRNEENPQLRESVSAVFDTAPTADVRPVVRGKWKPVMSAGNPNIQERDEWYGPLFVCDKCNWTMIDKSNFCPNCGAKMDGGQDNV